MKTKIIIKTLILWSFILSTHFAFAANEATNQNAPPQDNPNIKYQCDTEIFYSWKPEPPSYKHETNKNPRGQQQTLPPVEPVEIFFSQITQEDPTEADAKKNLTRQLLTIQKEARNACIEEHENMSGCVNTQLKALGNSYNLTDFQTRRTFLEALTNDCEKKIGSCISTRASEITCSEILIKGTEAQGTENTADKDKTASNKGKKK